jgi:hypothetical protein
VRVRLAVGCMAVVAVVVLLGLVFPPIGFRPAVSSSADAAAPANGPPPLLQPRRVAFTTPGFQSWALLDTRTRKISGSANSAQTSDTVSMVKGWLAADFLRRAAQQGEKPSAARLNTLSIMIRDSDNDAAEDTFRRDGGTASIERLIRTCGLTDTRAVPDRWSETVMSARDAVRMGACLADGRAAGKQWTSWVLNEMRRVRGDGRFGVVDALPATVASRVAIKNGWLLRDTDNQWHVNCLAVGDGWILAVMMRYAPELGFEHGGTVCASVTRQLLNPAVVASPAPAG